MTTQYKESQFAAVTPIQQGFRGAIVMACQCLMRIFSSLSPANASLRAAEVPCGKWGGLQSSSVRFHQPGKTRSLAALEGQLTSICSPEPS